MGTKRLRCGPSRRRRGSGRAVVCVAALTLGLLAGCGQPGHGARTDSEKAADTELLNALLAQELTLVRAYRPSARLARGTLLALLLHLRGQDQAHLDALSKAIRGVGGEADAEPEALELEGVKDRVEALTLAYEEENAALGQALDAVPRLQTPAPRALAAALAASHAQHLVVLRQGLGSAAAASIPNPFETGDEPPPLKRR